MNTNIIGKALLCQLSISLFNPSRRDKTASAEVILSKNAKTGAAEVRKLLLPKEATDPLAALAREIRKDYYKMTLPWDADGVRLLPTAMWLEFSELMSTHRHRFDTLVAEFVREYQTYRQRAMVQLGLLFDSKDYPDVADVHEKFGLRVHWNPLPQSDDFRLTLGAEDLDELQRDLDDRVTSAVQLANQDLYDRLGERLRNVSERLSDPDNVFRDSMIEGLRELCKLIPGLNVTDDPRLGELCSAARETIARHDPQDLRDNDELRDLTKKSADAILAQMGIAPMVPGGKESEG